MIDKTLSVPHISCDHCKTSIEGAVFTLTGVEAAQVDINQKTVRLTFDERAISLTEIVDAINAVGYEVAN
jgi:copper ion binding protein